MVACQEMLFVLPKMNAPWRKIFWRLLRSHNINPASLYRGICSALGDDNLFALWCHWEGDERNFGDAFNPELIRWISGRKVVSAAQTPNWRRQPVHCVIGSTLGLEGRLFDAVKKAPLVIWGAGFMYEGSSVKITPKMIFAVRGPLSRQIFLRAGVSCPAVYGDPVLLCPRFYKPKVAKRYRLGVVPHYVDKEIAAARGFGAIADVKVIDIEGGILDTIDQIASCERIVSSSLHGMVVADAYGIPSAWVAFSDQVEGAGFKFRDYLASVGRQGMSAVRVTTETTVIELMDRCVDEPIQVDLDQLWEACPFRNDNTSG